MLKVVVFDSGFGGELFADQLEEELTTIEVIRVIDWRNAKEILENPKKARKIAESSLRPFIGKVNLIILANHLLTITSLKYFERKYKMQKFIGFSLKEPDTFIKHDVLVLTTTAVAKTINYYNFLFKMKRKTKTLALDSWPGLIDDGELTGEEIKNTLEKFERENNFHPEEIILACSQFNDIKNELRKVFGHNIKIYDSFYDCLRKTCRVLNLRGGLGKKMN